MSAWYAASMILGNRRALGFVPPPCGRGRACRAVGTASQWRALRRHLRHLPGRASHAQRHRDIDGLMTPMRTRRRGTAAREALHDLTACLLEETIDGAVYRERGAVVRADKSAASPPAIARGKA